MNWFRVYHDIIDDPKILAMPRVYRWHVIELLAVSSRQPRRGLLPTPDELALHLRVTTKRINQIIKMLIDHKFIDASEDWSILKIHGWENRQFKSDDISARSKPAMQRSRERSQEPELNVHVNDHVTLHETFPPRSPLGPLDVPPEPPLNPPIIPPETPHHPPPPRGGVVEFVLPDWITHQDWEDYLAMRLRIRKPATSRAKELVIAKLNRLRAEGNDPNEVLQQSILSCHQSVWPIQVPYANGKPSDQPKSKPKPIVTPEEDERINARFK